MKLGLLTASLLLVAGGAMGCGSDDSGDGGDGGGEAKGTSETEFCDAFQGFYDDLTSVTGTEENLGKVLKDAAAQVEEAGTPDDIPDDAKDGLQLTLDAIDSLADDATAEDIAGLESDFSEDDEAKSQAFSDYLEETCPEIGGSTDAPSAEVPTEDSTDAPSDDES